MKAMSVLGIIFSIIFFLWYLLFITSDGAISVEEFSSIGVVFGLWSIAFSIISTINSFKKINKKKKTKL